MIVKHLVLKSHGTWKFAEQNINLALPEHAFSESLQSEGRVISTSNIASKIGD